MILLMTWTSAIASSPSPLPEPSGAELSAQPQAHDTFGFADYCALVGASQEMQQWLDVVADMWVDRTFPIYQSLDKKIRFISAMKDAGYEIDNDQYLKLMDGALDVESRNSTAEGIINVPYGDLILDYLQRNEGLTSEWVLTESMVFQEAYYKEFPDAIEQECNDAWGYWDRDLLRRPELLAAQARMLARIIDEAYVIEHMEYNLSEYFEWLNERVLETAVIDVIFDEEYQLWHCIATIDKGSVKPRLIQYETGDYAELGGIVDLGDSYQLQMVVEPYGFAFTRVGVTPAEYAAEVARRSKDNNNYNQIAFEGVMSRFALSHKELDRYFLYSTLLFPDKDNNWQAVVLFREHSYDGNARDWSYGAIVNAGTGELLDCFDKDMLKMRPPSIGAPRPTWLEKNNIFLQLEWYSGTHFQLWEE